MNKINQVNFFQMHGIEGMQPMRLNGNISLNSDDVNVKSFKDTFGEMISQIIQHVKIHAVSTFVKSI